MLKRLLFIVIGTAFLAACETASTTSGDAAGEVTTSAAAETTSTAASSTSTSSTASSSSSSAATAEAALSPEEELKREFAKVGSTVLFDFDSSALSDYAQRTLDRQAAFLNARPQARVIIGGHADERGTREYNLALGERRATAVRDYLVSKGINSDRIRTISYGKERPSQNGSNEAAWRLNRRSETVLN
jgi:peptidoglycan-associated lipoprotein